MIEKNNNYNEKNRSIKVKSTSVTSNQFTSYEKNNRTSKSICKCDNKTAAV